MEHRTDSRRVKRGFTLVEVLVASAIITVVMIVAIGSIITMQDANRKAQAVRAIIDNLHGALENMSRKIRTGNTYHCGDPQSNYTNFGSQECAGEGFETAMAFMATDDVDSGANGVPTVYRMECTPLINDSAQFPDAITKSCADGQTGTITYYKEGLFNDFEPLVDPKIDVTGLRFYVRNADGTNGYPSVLITLKGNINIERVNTPVPFNIQTTISQYLK